MNSYANSLRKNLPTEYKFISIKKNPEWKKSLKHLCNSITESNESRSSNYSEKRFPINEQIDVVLLVEKQKILAFSSLWHALHFPKNYVRVLNRTWKDPSIRSKNAFQRKIMVVFLAYQIDLALENKNIEFLFSSMEGIRSNWWKRWTVEANKVYSGWKIYPKLVKVCDGPYNKCWQSCAYLSLGKDSGSQFFLPSITSEEWSQLIEIEK